MARPNGSRDVRLYHGLLPPPLSNWLGSSGVAQGERTESNPKIGRLLVAALRGDQVVPESAAQLLQLIEAAAHHGVLLAVRRAYPADRADPHGQELVESARRLRGLALRIAHEAVAVSTSLRDAGVHHAVLKGPAIATAYPDSDREFVDLDVLVDPADMTRATTELERHGARILKLGGSPRRDGVGELVLGLRSGVSVDLHADLIHHDAVRRQFNLPTEPLLARTTTATVLGRELPVLDPEDSCIYVALHAAISGGDRLVWLADLDALVRQGSIRWTLLIARARNSATALVVAVMLERTATVLGSPVPRAVLKELRRGGRIWCSALKAFERRRPTAENHGRVLRGQILVRSTRRNTSASMRELARLTWEEVVLFVVTDSSHPWRVRVRRRRHDLAQAWRR